jgi:Rho GDP-dissociation inhibitor
MEIVPEGREPIMLEPGKEPECVLKEGTPYSVWVNFYVQHNIVLGVKWVNVVKRAMVTVSKDQDMIGSFAPQADLYRLKLTDAEAPSGMMARGSYKGTLRVMDDDQNVYTELPYKLHVRKQWE